ncbi:hypothetical protein [Georgenia sp. SUBG003]|uniref:hypothetical protein n=1 Tax=Georgenia sp. SUBG003 TaxID=1497974 RepID=UPI003AB3C6F6
MAAGERPAVDVADDGAWLVLHRGAVDVVLVLADGATVVPLPTGDAGSPDVVLSWGETALAPDGTSLTVQGPGVAVLRST